MSKQTFGSFLPVVSSQKKNKDYHRLGDSIVVWNKKRESVKDIAKPEEYNHVVLDIDTPLAHTVQVIIGSQPDLVLVPINTSQKR